MTLEQWISPIVRGRLVTICSALSLASCVGVSALWAASFRYPQFIFYDWIEKEPPVEVRSVSWNSDNGATYVTADRTIAETDVVGAAWLSEAEPRGFQEIGFTRRAPSRGITDGFSFWRLREQNKELALSVEVWSIGAPYWFLTLATAVFPGLWVLRRRHHRRRAISLLNGLCASCGYDLCGTPDRCPECGVVPDRAGAAA